MAAMAPWMWFVGFAALIPLAFVFPNPIILLIILFAGVRDLPALAAAPPGGAEQRAPTTAVRPLDRVLVAAVYLSLIALLVVGHGRDAPAAHDQLEPRARRHPQGLGTELAAAPAARSARRVRADVPPCGSLRGLGGARRGPPERVDAAPPQPDETEHEQHRAGGLEVDPAHVGGHAPTSGSRRRRSAD